MFLERSHNGVIIKCISHAVIFWSGMESLSHVFNVDYDSPSSKAYLIYSISMTPALLPAPSPSTQDLGARMQSSTRDIALDSVPFHKGRPRGLEELRSTQVLWRLEYSPHRKAVLVKPLWYGHISKEQDGIFPSEKGLYWTDKREI